MILVTGGAGYIGSHFVLHERARGEDVVIADDLVRGHREAAFGSALLVGDVADRAFLDRVFAAYRVDAVVHFAALAYVGESMSEPERYFRNNVGGTRTLLEAMRDHGVDQLVFSSSCATYGDPAYIPIDEAHPQRPINPYGETKLVCERMLEAFAADHGLRWVALRYFNAGGADPEGRAGESHDPETHLVPLALRVAAGRQPALTVFGADWPTPDGTCVRDYIHVVDLASAHSLALDHLRGGGANLALNLGTERGHSVLEIARACERITARPIPITTGPRRDGDPPILVASAERARRELGWTPRFAIDDIVASAWRWLQEPRY